MDRMLHYLAVLKDYARDYILENTGLKFLALLITAVLWLSVASRPMSQITLRDVPIEFPNLPNDLALTISNDDSLAARVYLSGPRDVLDTLRAGDLVVYADLKGVEPGVRVIPLKLDEGRLPSSVKVQRIDPRDIRVTVEPMIEKDVPVAPRFDGQPPEGFDILGTTITPSTVRIGGVASAVGKISEIPTETVNLSDKTEPFSREVKLDLDSPNVTLSNKRDVMLTVNIGEVQKDRVIERVPVTVTGTTTQAQPVPRFVKVALRGGRSAIDSITPADITVKIEYHAGAGKPNEYTPVVTISPTYADRIAVQSVEPKTIRLR
jgi:YbbR domain-containing protein